MSLVNPPHGHCGQLEEEGKDLTREISAKVRKGLDGIWSPTCIESCQPGWQSMPLVKAL